MGQPLDIEGDIGQKEMSRLDQIIHDDPNAMKIMQSERQTSHKVHGDPFLFSLGNG